jgi:hypothetical protein
MVDQTSKLTKFLLYFVFLHFDFSNAGLTVTIVVLAFKEGENIFIYNTMYKILFHEYDIELQNSKILCFVNVSIFNRLITKLIK